MTEVLVSVLYGTVITIPAFGLVVGVHASGLPLPNMKPFNCPFCSMVWIGSILFLLSGMSGSYVDGVLRFGSILAASAVLATKFPFLFREFTPADTGPRQERSGSDQSAPSSD